MPRPADSWVLRGGDLCPPFVAVVFVVALAGASACSTEGPPNVTRHDLTKDVAGPTLSPPRVLRIAARKERRRLLVYLHGYGSRAEDLYPTAAALAATFPDAESLLPDGFASTNNGAGRQWWSVEGMTDANRTQRIRSASVDFERWLDAELASRSLSNQDVTLLGFSQGAALAVSVGSRRSLQAVVSFCGRPPAVVSETQVTTPFLLVHGAHDQLISVSDATRFEAALRARGTDVEFRLLPELGHAINREAVEIAREFVAAALSRAAHGDGHSGASIDAGATTTPSRHR